MSAGGPAGPRGVGGQRLCTGDVTRVRPAPHGRWLVADVHSTSTDRALSRAAVVVLVAATALTAVAVVGGSPVHRVLGTLTAAVLAVLWLIVVGSLVAPGLLDSVVSRIGPARPCPQCGEPVRGPRVTCTGHREPDGGWPGLTVDAPPVVDPARMCACGAPASLMVREPTGPDRAVCDACLPRGGFVVVGVAA